MERSLTAIEFFSGIGAFAVAASKFGIKVKQAFDQSVDANAVYWLNFGESPSNANLDSIRAEKIADADVWWLSPPCKPYTIRGAQRDMEDARAKSLLNLIEVMRSRKPSIVMLENVAAFAESEMKLHLLAALHENNYQTREYQLCPTMFGIPMKRPRFFLVGERSHGTARPVATYSPDMRNSPRVPLKEFVSDEDAAALSVPASVVQQYQDGLNIIDPADREASAICFTSGYGRSLKASGSLLRTASGAVRYFAPDEMLSLFGFPSSFGFPNALPLKTQWRLLGNSVDIRCIEWLLEQHLHATTCSS